jgi:hypothetical protein
LTKSARHKPAGAIFGPRGGAGLDLDQGFRFPGAMQHAAVLRRDASQNRDRTTHRRLYGPGSAVHRSASAARCTASGKQRARWPAPGGPLLMELRPTLLFMSALAEERFEWMARGTSFPALLSTDFGD